MKIVQAMHVEQNAEMLIYSSIVHTGQMNMGNMKLNLADFTRASIKPENINIDVKQGELLLDIKYQKKGEDCEKLDFEFYWALFYKYKVVLNVLKDGSLFLLNLKYFLSKTELLLCKRVMTITHRKQS